MLSVWMLTTVTKIVTAAHRDLSLCVCANLLTNPDHTPKTRSV